MNIIVQLFEMIHEFEKIYIAHKHFYIKIYWFIIFIDFCSNICINLFIYGLNIFVGLFHFKLNSLKKRRKTLMYFFK